MFELNFFTTVDFYFKSLLRLRKKKTLVLRKFVVKVKFCGGFCNANFFSQKSCSEGGLMLKIAECSL